MSVYITTTHAMPHTLIVIADSVAGCLYI